MNYSQFQQAKRANEITVTPDWLAIKKFFSAGLTHEKLRRLYLARRIILAGAWLLIILGGAAAIFAQKLGVGGWFGLLLMLIGFVDFAIARRLGNTMVVGALLTDEDFYHFMLDQALLEIKPSA